MVNIRYRCFYPNICHYCKKFGKDVQLSRCRKCNMIAYCSEEHRQRDETHKFICNHIVTVRKIFDVTRKTSQAITDEDWLTRKILFIREAKNIKGKRLTKAQREMIAFERSCVNCHRQDDLQDCPNCGSVSFCTDHQRNNVHNAEACATLALCLKLDQWKAPTITLSYIRHLEEETLPASGKEFFNAYIKPYLRAGDRMPEILDTIRILHSEYFTRPLTLLYAAKRINYDFNKESITIHVIGSNLVEAFTAWTWELLLHFISQIKYLKIIFIGPNKMTLSEANLCSRCSKKKLLFEKRIKFYVNYMNSTSFEKPDIIIGFNIAIRSKYVRVTRRLDPWRATMIELIKRIPDDCPFIMSNYTKDNVENGIAEIDIIARKHVDYAIKEPNPFASLKPRRDLYTELPVYSNYYITAYASLK